MSQEKEAAGGGTVTEEELLKSLQKIEGKEPEKKEEKEQKPAVVATGLQKSASQHIKDEGSDDLMKSLDVSSVLSEAVSLMGAHVDNALEHLAKSINSANARDLAILGSFERLIKKVGELEAKLDTFGQNPAGAATAVTAVKVLEKSVKPGEGGQGGEGGGEKVGPTRDQVLGVMMNLAKSATPGSAEQKRWTDATVKFEATGQASNQDLLAVNLELKKAG